MEYVIVNNDELYHYGVKGMRWGVRKARRNEKQAIKTSMKATTDKERRKALADAKKYHNEATRLKKAHADAKAQKKHMRLNKDGSITEISQEKIARGRKIAKGIALGTVGTVGVAAAAVAFAPIIDIGVKFNGLIWEHALNR